MMTQSKLSQCGITQQDTDANTNKSKRPRVLISVSSLVMFAMTSLSVNASTLISSTDYLDYQLSSTLEEQCLESQNCPKIEVKYLKTNHEWLNKIVNARIDHSVVNIKPTESGTPTASHKAAVKWAIDDFVKSQFTDVPEGTPWSYQLMVTPNYIGHVDNFEIFEITSYAFTGGAHGMSYSEYLLFDSNTEKQVKLDDMLVRGQKSRFEAQAYSAYKAWVKTIADDSSNYEKNWPFVLSDNVILTDKGVDIRYQHYAIGPYAYGMPVLSISYAKLDGIIKPRYLNK